MHLLILQSLSQSHYEGLKEILKSFKGLNKSEKTAFSVQASGQDATVIELQCDCNATAMQPNSYTG